MVIDNLFFRKNDGSVLAIHINSAMGPELLRVLRGLSQQSSPVTQLSKLPFALAPSTTLDDDLANDAHKLSLTANGSTRPPSSAPVPRRKATVSVNTLAPVLSASTALSRVSGPTSSTETFNTEAWVDQIFSSADGKPYDRDWIRVHNVNENVLKGIPSKHKLDLLVRHGAVVVGDKLRVTYHSSGNPVIVDGIVSLSLDSIIVIISNPISLLGSTKLYQQQPLCPNRARSRKIRRDSPHHSRSKRPD